MVARPLAGASRTGTPPFAARGVALAVGATELVLTVLSSLYGYHRDELYFAMLPSARGYVDQPPLVPLLAHVLGSSPSRLRIPPTASANNAGETRVFAWVFLVIALGPVLVPVWLAGLRALWTRPQWRLARFLLPSTHSARAGDGRGSQCGSLGGRLAAAATTRSTGCDSLAGAVRRFTELQVYSGRKALYDLGPPPEGTDTVVYVGGQVSSAARYFAECDTVAELDNGVGVGVDNEEQGMPIAVCTGPRQACRELWPQLHHLD